MTNGIENCMKNGIENCMKNGIENCIEIVLKFNVKYFSSQICIAQ